MSVMTEEEQKHDQAERSLEAIVDSVGMTVTVELLGLIALHKSDHLLETYQDEDGSRSWYAWARYLEEVPGNHRDRVFADEFDAEWDENNR